MLNSFKKTANVAFFTALISPMFFNTSYANSNTTKSSKKTETVLANNQSKRSVDDFFGVDDYETNKVDEANNTDTNNVDTSNVNETNTNNVNETNTNSSSGLETKVSNPDEIILDLKPLVAPDVSDVSTDSLEIFPPADIKIISPDSSSDTSAILNINNTYKTTGYARVLNREDFKNVKTYISHPDFEKIFEPRNDFYIIIHTTEFCRNEHGKELCSSSDNLARYLKSQKSTHFFIGDDCKTYAIVRIEDLADAVGQSLWNGTYALNVNSVSVEVYANVEYKVSNTHKVPIMDCQYEELAKLIPYLQKIRNIPDKNVLGHNQVAVTYKYATRQRKGDPGKNFDWSKINLPNNYLLIDHDILAGRARNTSDSRTFSLRALPGQICSSRYAQSNIKIAGEYIMQPTSDTLSCSSSNSDVATVKK